jgi:hypothetical protein
MNPHLPETPRLKGGCVSIVPTDCKGRGLGLVNTGRVGEIRRVGLFGIGWRAGLGLSVSVGNDRERRQQ